jgi:RNA polymerase sigma factor (sigma-70 family)
LAHEPTVFIVDDDPSVRRVLGQLFRCEGLPSASFSSAQQFLEDVDADRPGCLLLDVRMPGASGLELQDTLLERGMRLPIIFMTAYADVPMSVRAMKAGAVDFVEKPFNEQQLLEAVHRGLERDRQAREAARARHRAEQRIRSLTPRERQVLALVVAGRTNREIADEWGISEKTVKVHRGRVMEKTRVNTLPELVLLAQAAGIRTTKVVPD